jgi:hypothetical protein
MVCPFYTNTTNSGVRKLQMWATYSGSGTVVVKALCYKPEGRGFDIR